MSLRKRWAHRRTARLLRMQRQQHVLQHQLAEQVCEQNLLLSESELENVHEAMINNNTFGPFKGCFKASNTSTSEINSLRASDEKESPHAAEQLRPAIDGGDDSTHSETDTASAEADKAAANKKTLRVLAINKKRAGHIGGRRRAGRRRPVSDMKAPARTNSLSPSFGGEAELPAMINTHANQEQKLLAMLSTRPAACLCHKRKCPTCNATCPCYSELCPKLCHPYRSSISAKVATGVRKVVNLPQGQSRPKRPPGKNQSLNLMKKAACNHCAMVRVGGGFVSLADYLKSHNKVVLSKISRSIGPAFFCPKAPYYAGKSRKRRPRGIRYVSSAMQNIEELIAHRQQLNTW